MSLLQPGERESSENTENRFTFHNVSITTKMALSRTFLKHIYIPQCLYYNINHTSLTARDKHLHSTMSLLQQKSLINNALCIAIYIPQCLYYNSNSSCTSQSCTIDLHSTMSLLQQDRCLMTSVRDGFIYIPQCLYYNYATSE